MFNMVLKFVHYLCNRSDFCSLKYFEKLRILNINTRLIQNFEDLGNRSDFLISWGIPDKLLHCCFNS